ncbi:MAG: efflux RND transporter permease subunit [Myxococcota bacterium]
MKRPLTVALMRGLIERPPVVWIGILGLVVAGLVVSPFSCGPFPTDPVSTDALPNLGDNQQIVFAEWPGRSPSDVEDQVSYPLTTALLGTAGVESVRSTSMFGFAVLFVVFEEGREFHDSRSHILEKLASLPPRLLPPEVSPRLGPDATPLGQVFGYTLVGQTPSGESVGGWSLHELRTLQDFTIRYALQSVPGVTEVASIGGHVRELQVDVDPDALASAQVSLEEVAAAVRMSSSDVGLRTTEINKVEYLLRSEGTAKSLEDVRSTVVAVRDGVPLRIGDLAHVRMGPAPRRGALDDSGAETVGGIVVARHAANPVETIRKLRARMAELEQSLPSKTLEDGRQSQIRIVPFYDRTELIEETLGTLSEALTQQLLVTMIVVLVLLRSLGASILISVLLPLGISAAFVSMKLFDVHAHIMALAGIAIAIGTMVDMGIVLIENISVRLKNSSLGTPSTEVVAKAAAEVAPAILTSTLTTVVGFLPVFALQAEEGRMFRPLAFTKTFAMLAALGLALLCLPTLARFVLAPSSRFSAKARTRKWLESVLVLGLGFVLSLIWMPLGRGASWWANQLCVASLLVLVLGGIRLFMGVYPRMLDLCLRRPRTFALAPMLVLLGGLFTWLGAPRLLSWLPETFRQTRGVQALFEGFPGLDGEYMPPFDEGSFLVMPSTMPHASFGESLRLLQLMDARIAQIPEVDKVIGKMGRADTALDPAPISMFETLVTLHPEYEQDDAGRWRRRWREHIRSSEDLWREVEHAARLPGLTGAPFLQPIETRQIMLRSGMRSPLGLKLQGPSLDVLAGLSRELETVLREVPTVDPSSVIVDRIVAKPYLEVDFDREALARHGLSVGRAHAFLEKAVGGMVLGRTREGRKHLDIRIRHLQEDRDSLLALRRLPVDTPLGSQVPLESLAELRYALGPQSIRSEDGFLTSYLTFSGQSDVAESKLVDQVQTAIEVARREGRLRPPAGGRWSFAGSFEARAQTEERLALLLPATLLVVFLLLYLQFRSTAVALLIFTGVGVALSGAFILLGLYGHEGFLDFGPLRTLFGVETINLSVAVWVGIIALVGIASDDGVLMVTYLEQSFAQDPPRDATLRRARIIEAARRRLRPCLMTTATTFIALLPVVSATGRGADLMRPMAVPILGGMMVELLTLFVVPVLYAALAAHRSRSRE